jgi:hypothetical protein
MDKINRSTVASKVACSFTALPLSVAEAERQDTVTQAEFAQSENYGAGCSLGHAQAEAWIANPKRGSYGGTLQDILLEYAKRFARARSAAERESVRGQIVGFSYRLECPEHAIALDAYARKKRMEAARASQRQGPLSGTRRKL